MIQVWNEIMTIFFFGWTNPLKFKLVATKHRILPNEIEIGSLLPQVPWYKVKRWTLMTPLLLVDPSGEQWSDFWTMTLQIKCVSYPSFSQGWGLSTPTIFLFSLVTANKAFSIFCHLGDTKKMFKSRGGTRRGPLHRKALYADWVLIPHSKTEE